MEVRNENEFSWQTLFFVTGISFVLFSLVLRLLEGVHSAAMLWTGAISLIIGSLIWVINLTSKTPVRKKRKYPSSTDLQ